MSLQPNYTKGVALPHERWTSRYSSLTDNSSSRTWIIPHPEPGQSLHPRSSTTLHSKSWRTLHPGSWRTHHPRSRRTCIRDPGEPFNRAPGHLFIQNLGPSDVQLTRISENVASRKGKPVEPI